MYRPNVCVVITNKQKDKVLMFRRIGMEEKGWQFPQGGIDLGETEKEALYRELKEEIGTNNIEILKKSKNRIKYEFPEWVMEKFAQQTEKDNPLFKGQKQRWYLVQLKGDESPISFEHEPAEFDDFEWVSIGESLKRIISFKQKAYKEGLKQIGMLD